MARKQNGNGKQDIEAALGEARRVHRLLERIGAWEARQHERTKARAAARREKALGSASPTAQKLLRTAGGA